MANFRNHLSLTDRIQIKVISERKDHNVFGNLRIPSILSDEVKI